MNPLCVYRLLPDGPLDFSLAVLREHVYIEGDEEDRATLASDLSASSPCTDPGKGGSMLNLCGG